MTRIKNDIRLFESVISCGGGWTGMDAEFVDALKRIVSRLERELELRAARSEHLRLRLKYDKPTDAQRLNYLWRSLPFAMRHRFGGDEEEMRAGIDFAMRQLSKVPPASAE